MKGKGRGEMGGKGRWRRDKWRKEDRNAKRRKFKAGNEGEKKKIK